MRILTEASGSLTSAYLIKSIQAAGHEAIASDIHPDCAGNYLADGFIMMPKSSDPELWDKVGSILTNAGIDLVIPSFDETLLGWAQGLHKRTDECETHVLLSPPSVIDTFVDKWKAFEFFVANDIPTPRTSLKQNYSLIKPRWGRGGKGVRVELEPVDMDGCISQELALGDEYTVDVLCDNSSRPIYIVPRMRQGIRDGKSTQGIVMEMPGIEQVVRKICSATRFRGPINIQCFCDAEGRITVIEVNPRIAGGMALGFAATENWVPLMVSMILGQEQFDPLPVSYGMKMMRYYAEVFTR